MNMDWLLWVVRAVLIIVGIITIIIIGRRKKEGIYQGQYYIGIFVVGITAFILGVILLITYFMTDLSLFYGLYLIAAGAVALSIGLVARYIWRKHR